jgi:uncharacterized protein (UPF0212 family)
MVAHQQIKTGVADVDKWLNKHEIPLDRVQIVVGMTKCTSFYMIFYNTEDDKHPEME